jgi:membrane protein
MKRDGVFVAELSQIVGFAVNGVQLLTWVCLFWMIYLGIKLIVILFYGIKLDENPTLTYRKRVSSIFTKRSRYQISFFRQHKAGKFLALIAICVTIVFCNSYIADLLYVNNVAIHKTPGTYFYHAYLTRNGRTLEGIAELKIESQPFGIEKTITLEEFLYRENGSSTSIKSNHFYDWSVQINENCTLKYGDSTMKCFVTIFPDYTKKCLVGANDITGTIVEWVLFAFFSVGVCAYIFCWRFAKKQREIAVRPNKLKFSIALYRICQLLLIVLWIGLSIPSGSIRWFAPLIPILLFCLCNGKPEEMQTANNQPGSPSVDAD